jgi:hypothetical protein
MVFENQKKLFVHIPKCAGMTIRKSPVLEPYLVVATPNNHKSEEYTAGLHKAMRKSGDHHGNEHARWRDIKPSVRNLYDAFAVTRNPWDRVVSRYFFAKKVIEVEKKVPVGFHNIDSFEHFLEERFDWGGKEYYWHRAIRGWFPAVDHVCDTSGTLVCDMMRFEHLNEDLCEYFDIPEMSRARNVTDLNKGTYQDLYNDKTIQIVADWYKEDIDMWGYDFDTGAQRNYWNENL